MPQTLFDLIFILPFSIFLWNSNNHESRIFVFADAVFYEEDKNIAG